MFVHEMLALPGGTACNYDTQLVLKRSQLRCRRFRRRGAATFYSRCCLCLGRVEAGGRFGAVIMDIKGSPAAKQRALGSVCHRQLNLIPVSGVIEFFTRLGKSRKNIGNRKVRQPAQTRCSPKQSRSPCCPLLKVPDQLPSADACQGSR